MPSAPDDNDHCGQLHHSHLKCCGEVDVVAASPKSGEYGRVVERQVPHHVELDQGSLILLSLSADVYHHHIYAV